MWLVSVTRSQVWRGAGVLSLSLSHTGHWKFNMAPHGKELSEDLKKRSVALHKDGVDYKKIAKTLKLSCRIWTLGPIWTFSLRGVLTFVASGLDINGCVELFWGRQQIYTVIQAEHSLLYIVAKWHFFNVVTWKDIIKYLQKMWGVYSLIYTHTHTCLQLYFCL